MITRSETLMEIDWTKVVTEPLGLAAFAIALIFASRRRGAHTPRWWPPTAIGLAVVCVVGGLLLFYARIQLGPNNVAAEQKASATGVGSMSGNINGSGDSIGTHPASTQPSSGNPVGQAATTTPAPVSQTAEAHDGGTAINVNGSGNSVDVSTNH